MAINPLSQRSIPTHFQQLLLLTRSGLVLVTAIIEMFLIKFHIWRCHILEDAYASCTQRGCG